MCPIGCDIMRDPVTLPTSGQIMDRPAITRHLLSDSQDPYNRKPLTVEMLEPNDALREEIEEWIRQATFCANSQLAPAVPHTMKHGGNGMECGLVRKHVRDGVCGGKRYGTPLAHSPPPCRFFVPWAKLERTVHVHPRPSCPESRAFGAQ
ncbi:unnamed protein product [Ectocarpus sp. 12 AP-2014]